jgi:hypothetical protein
VGTPWGASMILSIDEVLPTQREALATLIVAV